MTRDYYTKDQFNAEWGELTLAEKIDKLGRQAFPHLWKRPPAPPPNPADKLWDPSPVTDQEFLQERFRLLTRGCFVDDPRQYTEEFEDYSLDWGQKLPRRYRNEDGRIIERDTGADLTQLMDLNSARSKARSAYDAADSPFEWERDEEQLDALWEAFQDASMAVNKAKGAPHRNRRPRPEYEPEEQHEVRSKVFG